MIEVRNINNQGVRYVVNYGAHIFQSNNTMAILWSVLTNNMDGAYFLERYDDSIYSYVNEGQRSLWEYKLNLSKSEIELFEDHLYDLKGHEIRYSIFNNNCADGIKMLLAAISEKYQSNNNTFETPISYAQDLYQKNLIDDNISIRPSVSDKYAIENNYLGNPLETRKPSRISISTTHIDSDYQSIEYSPILRNLDDDVIGLAEPASTEYLKFNLRYNDRENRLFIHKITLAELNIIPSFQANGNTAKHFSISFNGNEFDSHTRLYPEFKGGLGIGYRIFQAQTYAQLNLSYHQLGHAIIAANPQIGLFIRNETIGTIHSYFERPITETNYFYHGYKNKFSFKYSKLLLDNFSISINFDNYKLPNSKQHNEISTGLVFTY